MPSCSGVPLAQKIVHERFQSFGVFTFQSLGFLWLKLQNMQRANQRLKERLTSLIRTNQTNSILCQNVTTTWSMDLDLCTPTNGIKVRFH